ncbi:MAG TPA: phospholipase D family protein [Gemmataceae bacterium]|nr:phospholipase D family protein [Gemmataceae bacterium]
MMMWLLLATGFTGGLTVVFYMRRLYYWFVTPPSIDVFYSPKGGCTEAVVRELGRARREVLIQAYSFTSKPIADALVQAKTRGVTIEILLDRSNEQETYTELGHLIDKGITPLIDAQHAIAHNKVMIIDKRTLITGSFNFTHQAEAENAENLLIIKGHRALVHSYHDYFASHKSHCQAPGGKASTAHRRAAA